jgi:DNA-binding FadR family transcriptional regulator
LPSSSSGRQPKSAARAVAACLREEILALNKESAFLGSEDELLARLGVSRPTLRQATRILEHENILEVRRCAGGGLFTRMPTAKALSDVASVYLRSRGTTLTDLNRAAALVVPEIARVASLNPSASEPAHLAAFADSPEHKGLIGTPAFMRDVVQEFGLRLVALIDNPPLALFYEMLLGLAVSPFRVWVLADRRRGTRVLRCHNDLGEAIKAGKAELAIRVTKSYYATIDSWL